MATIRKLEQHGIAGDDRDRTQEAVAASNISAVRQPLAGSSIASPLRRTKSPASKPCSRLPYIQVRLSAAISLDESVDTTAAGRGRIEIYQNAQRKAAIGKIVKLEGTPPYNPDEKKNSMSERSSQRGSISSDGARKPRPSGVMNQASVATTAQPK